MQGLEFRHQNGRPYPEWRDAVLGDLMRVKPVGILTIGAGINDLNPVIRFEPCLTCNTEDLDHLDRALTQVI
jgi:acetylornithine/succinyldiaminopimelate/putrescine aminotransferase